MSLRVPAHASRQCSHHAAFPRSKFNLSTAAARTSARWGKWTAIANAETAEDWQSRILLICNQRVIGSSPIAGSLCLRHLGLKNGTGWNSVGQL